MVRFGVVALHKISSAGGHGRFQVLRRAAKHDAAIVGHIQPFMSIRSPGVCAFKSLYFWGDEDWHPSTEVWADDYSLAFAIYVEVSNPVEPTTWTGVKTLYR